MSCTILSSPAEPKDLISAVGAINSSMVEDHGSDFLIHFLLEHRPAIAGIQRKKIPDDLIASMEDGRLTKEIVQMKEKKLDVKILMTEGPFRYDRQDRLLRNRFPTRWTRLQIDNLLLSIQVVHGIAVIPTDGIWHTGKRILEIRKWLEEPSHYSLMAKKNLTATDGWYNQPPEEVVVAYFYDGIPGVGPGQARMMVKAFPGPAELALATVDQIQEVPGIGRPTAIKIWQFLQHKKWEEPVKKSRMR